MHWPTEAPAAALQSTVYTYDDDGNMVMSIIKGVTTYYPGRQYNQVVEQPLERRNSIRAQTLVRA